LRTRAPQELDERPHGFDARIGVDPDLELVPTFVCARRSRGGSLRMHLQNVLMPQRRQLLDRQFKGLLGLPPDHRRLWHRETGADRFRSPSEHALLFDGLAGSELRRAVSGHSISRSRSARPIDRVLGSRSEPDRFRLVALHFQVVRFPNYEGVPARLACAG
jgi:hypothetical protein